MKRKHLILAATCFVVALADQATKYWAVAHLTDAFQAHKKESVLERLAGFYTLKNLDNDPLVPEETDHRAGSVVVVDRYWDHRYVENPGAAWGLLSNVPDKFRVPFFHLVSLLAIGFIALFFAKLEPDQNLLAISLALILGGALGNYLDRLARNYVIDFVDWHWREAPNLHWPTFNLADAAISSGVALMLLEVLFSRRKPLVPLELALPAQDSGGQGSGQAVSEESPKVS